jgi:DNA-binding CsgD family transcriptional regulator
MRGPVTGTRWCYLLQCARGLAAAGQRRNGTTLQQGSAEQSETVGPRVDEPFRGLVEQLIEHAVASGVRNDDNVILDVEINGVRCLLILVEPDAGEFGLSPREREIVEMVAAGHPNKTIAAELDISSWTVSTHLRRVFAKLGVHSRAAMVARAVEAGLVAGRPHDRQVGSHFSGS